MRGYSPHYYRYHLFRQGRGKRNPHPVPEVWPPLVPCSEEKVRRLRVRSYHYAPKIFLAEQEDKQNPHSLTRQHPQYSAELYPHSETQEKWRRSIALAAVER